MCSNGCSRTPCERLVPITSPVPTSCTATKSSRRWHSTDSGTKWNSLTKSVRIAVATGTRHSIGSISARWAIAPIKQPISHSPNGFLTKSRCANETTPHAVEAMLLGVSGLLGLYEHDTYVLDLLRTFEHLAAKYTLEPMDASAWNLTDIRPANHPLLRIVQAARFFIRGRVRHEPYAGMPRSERGSTAFRRRSTRILEHPLHAWSRMRMASETHRKIQVGHHRHQLGRRAPNSPTAVTWTTNVCAKTH